MNPDLGTLVTALYVRIDDVVTQNPHWAPRRPVVGFAPELSEAELVTLTVLSAHMRWPQRRSAAACRVRAASRSARAAAGRGIGRYGIRESQRFPPASQPPRWCLRQCRLRGPCR